MSYPNRTRSTRELDGLTYAPGARFRVVREGLSLSGWRPDGPSSATGWGQALRVGDILTCTGFGPGWGSDPGFGVEFTSAASRAAGAGQCEVRPSTGGVWNYRPPTGSLEPVTDDNNTDQEV